VPGPDPGAFGGVDAGAIPAVSAFEVADPAFASGSPFDVAAERFSMLVGPPGLRGFAFAWNHDIVDAEVGELLVNLGLAVAAVGGDGARRAPGALLDSLHSRGQLRCVGGVALLDAVVEHDPVVIVDDLGFVAEFDRPAQPALGDRAGIGVVQADPPRRPIRGCARPRVGGSGPRSGASLRAAWSGR